MEKVFICVDDNALFQPVCDYGIYVAKTIKAEPVFIHVIESPELGENFYGLAAGGIVLGEKDMVLSQYGTFDEDSNKIDEEKLMELALEAGAEDVITEEDHYEVTCAVNDFYTLSKAFEEANLEAESAELVYLPLNTVPVNDKETAEKLNKLTERLEDIEDVKAVYSNYELGEGLAKEWREGV